MAFGQCGCVLNREVKTSTAKGSAGQDGAVTRCEALLWKMQGGRRGSHSEVGHGGSGRVSVALLALLRGISFSEWRSLSCPLEMVLVLAEPPWVGGSGRLIQ